MNNLNNYLKVLNNENVKISMSKRLQAYFYIFLMGGLIGWIYEEFFYFFTENWIGDRGFLYGPCLPVYGIGALCMILFLKPVKRYPWAVFLLGMLVTGVVEYITGCLMWQIWHHRWWDYTGLFFNISGYVCLRSVLSFAVGGIALIYFIEPYILKKCSRYSGKYMSTISVIFAVLLVADIIISVVFRLPATIQC